jgi:type I restriction-modification system DNA methylase subunit
MGTDDKGKTLGDISSVKGKRSPENIFNEKLNEIENVLSLGLDIVKSNYIYKGYNDEIICKAAKIYEKTFNYHREKRETHLFNEFIDPAENDIIGKLYENFIHEKNEDKRNGQFYTPELLANYMITLLNLTGDRDLLEKKFIDISCGSGVFLTNAAKSFSKTLKNRGVNDLHIILGIMNNFFGLDINPISCLMTKINLFIVCVNEVNPDVLFSENQLYFNVYETNSISKNDLEERDSTVHRLKSKIAEFNHGFDYVIGNPPYVEAKKLAKELKELARINFPNFTNGAFDLYIAFVAQSYFISAKNGKICLVLPNKFTVANYAIKLREFLLGNTEIEYIVDFSETQVFKKADVYPVVILFCNRVPTESHEVHTIMSVTDFEHLKDTSRIITFPQAIYSKTTKFKTLFYIPIDHSFYKKIIDIFERGRRLSEFLDLRTTVSFHKKGQRERFIKKEFDLINGSGIPVKKYLGGESYSRKNEVEKFRIRWAGYYIIYDSKSLKDEHNNLPPLYIFEKEKIIFCQHAKEMTATLDRNGEWVTKDVYPIAFTRNISNNAYPPLTFFTGLFNSKLFSFLYGLLYKGIQISQGYFHYLPSWLGELPMILPNKSGVERVSSITEALLNTKGDIDKSALNEIDEIIYRAYGLSEWEVRIVETTQNQINAIMER